MAEHSCDLAKLFAQGRAKSHGEPWTPEEWEQVVALEKERNISRLEAAAIVRAGVDNATEAAPSADAPAEKPKKVRKGKKN